MHILVTGATGYVGRSAALALTADGHRVDALTRDPGAERAVELSDAGVRSVRGDLGDPASLTAAIRDVDAVLHTAFDADDHVGTDRALFGALRTADQDGRHRHLVYTTGCSVYGPSDHPVLTESTPVDPDNRRARLEAELRATGIPHTILRPAMVHGGDARTSIVGRWFEAARAGRPVHHGRRDKRWSWVHVDDVADAYRAVLRDPAAQAGKVFLLAEDQPVEPLAVLQAAARTAGHRGAVSFAPIEDEIATYRVFDHDEIVDATQARTHLGWTPGRPDVLAELSASYAAWSRA
ncbi:NAD-dependent epimerase/dehydratase family protein [Microlunatus soli]|uniref:Nucleoside-diphosphate-sugar epimerase n=1 Tax=Microlunatus soli TaxID=630515 RepID=A0A1H1QWF9_9ACTN|nr:NAD-dependent epimerase/dehydratase family protein [Microlunatus soli]SDS27737.1 Nucleoside-diphosphate-sugar epimerase [Microlunatus soli]